MVVADVSLFTKYEVSGRALMLHKFQLLFFCARNACVVYAIYWYQDTSACMSMRISLMQWSEDSHETILRLLPHNGCRVMVCIVWGVPPHDHAGKLHRGEVRSEAVVGTHAFTLIRNCIDQFFKYCAVQLQLMVVSYNFFKKLQLHIPR